MGRKLLVDTSAWIDHLKDKTDRVRIAAFDDDIELVTHSMVIVELLLGGIKDNSTVMDSLRELSSLMKVTDFELTEFVKQHGISRKGIGYVDANLLASCVLENAELLSFDRKLNEVAKMVRVRVYTS